MGIHDGGEAAVCFAWRRMVRKERVERMGEGEIKKV